MIKCSEKLKEVRAQLNSLFCTEIPILKSETKIEVNDYVSYQIPCKN